jgi:hypothetical protein
MARRIELWRPLFAQAIREQGRKGDYLAGVAEYPELNARLAMAAAASKQWNPKTGQPRSGQANGFIKDLLTQDRLFPELEGFFRSFGYHVSVHTVESVVLCRWREVVTGTDRLPEPERGSRAERLQLSDDALVPCGGSILFSLTHKQD